MSRVVQFEEIGGPEKLQIVEAQIPQPAAGEVRIKVKALGLNRAESMFRSGQYVEEPKLPARLGYEAAGVIDAVGPDVKDLQVGDAVSVVPGFSLNQYGLYGDLVLAPAALTIKHPQNLTMEEAASIWMMYVTAYDGLISVANLAKGETVLIPAASSSVGIAAIQIANLVGAIPVALTRTSEKRADLLKAGAAHVIATEEQDLVAEVMKITKNKGAQVAYDPVGGPTFAKLVEAAAFAGRIILYGALSDAPMQLPTLAVLGKLLRIQSAMIVSTSADPAKLKVAVDFVCDGLKSGKLKPVIARTFAFDEIVEATKYLESNNQFGKIVVTV